MNWIEFEINNYKFDLISVDFSSYIGDSHVGSISMYTGCPQTSDKKWEGI